MRVTIKKYKFDISHKSESKENSVNELIRLGKLYNKLDLAPTIYDDHMLKNKKRN